MEEKSMSFKTGEMDNKPFENLLTIVSGQLDPETKTLEAPPVVAEEKIEVKDLPLTFSAIVSPSEKVYEETEVLDEDIPLPDLEVAALDESAIKDKIRTTRKWSEDAGETIITCEEGLKRLDELESDPDSAFSATTLRKQREIFERKLKAIYGYPNKAAVDHAIYSAMLTRLRKANIPDEGKETMDKTEDQGRFFRPTEEQKRIARAKNKGKWPSGTVFFPYEGEVIMYFSYRSEISNELSKGQEALVLETINMIKRVELNHVTQMAKKGHRNLIRLKKGVPGFYYNHARKGKDEKTGKMRLPGDLLVEVYDKNDHGEGKRTKSPFMVFKVVEATGSFSWLLRAMAKADLDYIPHYYLERGVIQDLDEAKQKVAWNVINCLKARIYAWENSQKPKFEEPSKIQAKVGATPSVLIAI